MEGTDYSHKPLALHGPSLLYWQSPHQSGVFVTNDELAWTRCSQATTVVDPRGSIVAVVSVLWVWADV